MLTRPISNTPKIRLSEIPFQRSHVADSDYTDFQRKIDHIGQKSEWSVYINNRSLQKDTKHICPHMPIRHSCHIPFMSGYMHMPPPPPQTPKRLSALLRNFYGGGGGEFKGLERVLNHVYPMLLLSQIYSDHGSGTRSIGHYPIHRPD